MPAVSLTEAFATQRQYSILLYGPPFSGKTRSLFSLWKLLPKLGYPPRVDFYDLDRNADSFLRAMTVAGAPADSVRVFRYGQGGDRVDPGAGTPLSRGEFDNFLRDYNSLWDYIDPATGKWNLAKCEKAGWQPPGAVVVDSASSLLAMILEFVCALEGKQLNAPGTDGRAFYGKQMGKIVEIISSLKKLPIVFVMTAHETLEKDENTQALRCDPSFTGKLAAGIAKHFTVCLYSTTQPGKGPDGSQRYVWLTQPKGYVVTSGTRFRDAGELGLYVDQDFEHVL